MKEVLKEGTDVYLVGGAVRDQLMGSQPKDLDYVIVGSSPEEMEAMGHKSVGKDFPVYLCGDDKSEYALARKERSTGDGYSDFVVDTKDVTLEEDLFRRDLTINAMARDKGGAIIDLFNGQKDIKDKILRNVSKHFREDPLRVLRVARFSSIHEDFKLSPSLLLEMEMAAQKLHTLPKERVWGELHKVLVNGNLAVFLDTLLPYDIFAIWNELCATPQRRDHHPEIYVGVHTDLTLRYAREHFKDPLVQFGVLCHDFGKPLSWEEGQNAHGHEEKGLLIVEDFCLKNGVPNAFRKLALLACKHHTTIHGVMGRGKNKAVTAKKLYAIFKETNAFNDETLIKNMLKISLSDARGRGSNPHQVREFANKPYPQVEYLLAMLKAAKDTDIKAVAAKAMEEGKKGELIGQAQRQAILRSINACMRTFISTDVCPVKLLTE